MDAFTAGFGLIAVMMFVGYALAWLDRKVSKDEAVLDGRTCAAIMVGFSVISSLSVAIGLAIRGDDTGFVFFGGSAAATIIGAVFMIARCE